MCRDALPAIICNTCQFNQLRRLFMSQPLELLPRQKCAQDFNIFNSFYLVLHLLLSGPGYPPQLWAAVASWPILIPMNCTESMHCATKYSDQIVYATYDTSIHIRFLRVRSYNSTPLASLKRIATCDLAFSPGEVRSPARMRETWLFVNEGFFTICWTACSTQPHLHNQSRLHLVGRLHWQSIWFDSKNRI